jgi:hypothetical protein
MEVLINDLIIGQYYLEYNILSHVYCGEKKFLGVNHDGFLIFDATLDARCHNNPDIFKYYQSSLNNKNLNQINKNLNVLVIEPNKCDPITFDDIVDGDIVVLINNDIRYMFKKDVFLQVYNKKQTNPYTNEHINFNQIYMYVVVVFP